MSEQVHQKIASFKEDVAKAEKCNDTSNVVVEKFLDPISMLFTKLFVKMNVHPNVVTIMSMITGIAGGYFFFVNNIWYTVIGIFLEFISVILDGSDGQVARITNKKSKLGRMLDGLSDTLVYLSIYIFISLRLMKEPIPFTNGVLWGGWIWAVSLFSGLILHMGQARIADYYKNVHMYFKNNERGNELDSTRKIKEEIKTIKNPIRRFCTRIYCFYTSLQEIRTPRLQKLLNAVSSQYQRVPEDISAYFTTRSKKTIKIANWLTYVFRTAVLFVLLLFKQHVFIFPFLLLVLEPIKIVLIQKYEKIAKDTYNQFIKESN